jgi:Flp pilus assembly protein TadD
MNETNYCQCEEKETLAPSYMVHVAGKPAPTVYHLDLQEAVAEATRLARKEQREVAVLQTIAVATPQEQPVEWAFADNVIRNGPAQEAIASAVTGDPLSDEEERARAAWAKIVNELFGPR